MWNSGPAKTQRGPFDPSPKRCCSQRRGRLERLAEQRRTGTPRSTGHVRAEGLYTNLELNRPRDEPRLTHLSQKGGHSSGEKAREDTMDSLYSGSARTTKTLGRSRRMTLQSWGVANCVFEKSRPSAKDWHSAPKQSRRASKMWLCGSVKRLESPKEEGTRGCHPQGEAPCCPVRMSHNGLHCPTCATGESAANA